tara:strand:- start:283 stop:657 length:375 start_codon:yes stop_codon:yes gene_type:complete
VVLGLDLVLYMLVLVVEEEHMEVVMLKQGKQVLQEVMLDQVEVGKDPMFHQMQVQEAVHVDMMVVLERQIFLVLLDQVVAVVLLALVVMETIAVVEQVVLELDFQQYSMIQQLHHQELVELAVD